MKFTFQDKITFLIFSFAILTCICAIYAQISGQFKTHKSWVYSIDTDLKGMLTSTNGNEVLLWKGRKYKGSFLGHSAAVKSSAFSNNGKYIVSGSIDKTVKIWSAVEKINLLSLDHHTEGVNNVEFSKSDKYVVSAGYDNRLIIWDWQNNEIKREFRIKHTYFSINDNDQLAFIDEDCNLKLFDLLSFNATETIGKYCGLPLLNSQKNILAIKDTLFTIIDLKTRSVLTTLDTEANSIYSTSTFLFSPDGNYIITGVSGGNIQVWDWQKAEILRTFHGQLQYSVNDLSFNSKNQLISASGKNAINIWNWETGVLQSSFGDGQLRSKTIKLIIILILLSLVVGFWAIIKSKENKLSSKIVLLILTVWSFGLGVFIVAFREFFTKYALPLVWLTTLISGIFLILLYFSFFALFTIPITLLFCYILLANSNRETNLDFLLLINLAYCCMLYFYFSKW